MKPTPVLACIAMLHFACGGDSPTAATPAPTPTPAVVACSTAPSTEAWQFTDMGAPLGNRAIETVEVDPQDGNTWYAGGALGLYITRDGGRSWVRSLTGAVQIGVVFSAGTPSTVYAAENFFPRGPHRIRRSVDKGLNWTTLLESSTSFRSLHAGRTDPRLLLAGTQTDPRATTDPDFFYQTLDGGTAWAQRPIDGRSRGLIPWDVGEDINGVLYSGTEIYDHPAPYQPPFFTSTDRGATWRLAAALSWHVTSIQVHPTQALVYALTEGAGLYSTIDAGLTWRRRGTSTFTSELQIDPVNPCRLYGGDIVFGSRTGGFHLSTDGGDTFRVAALQGQSVSSIALDAARTFALVASYNSGIYKAPIPPN